MTPFARLLLLALIFAALPLAAPVAGAGSARQAAPPTLGDDPALGDFFDGLLAAQMAAYRLPGAVVAVVHEGEVLFARGYGYADLEREKPVDPAETLFRPGSVSKLFIWTAVMQLVEQGAVDLDADVNRYLDFEIPSDGYSPVTMRHLMTHTPGFEDRGIGLFVGSEEALVPLGDYLRANVPARLYPPGEVGAYSNYGTALAAYVVERVAGMPYEQVVETRLFEPLQMRRSSFRQPPPPALEAELATGYRLENGVFAAGSYEWVQASPAGSLSAPALDMAHFMIAHLQEGRFGDSRILEPETARLMHSRQFTHHPEASGMTLGWMESRINGQRLIGHGGDTFDFHSLLTLIPAQNTGIYISFNSAGTNNIGAALAREELLQAFLDRYFPAAADNGAAIEPAGLGRFAGAYAPSRSNLSSPEKLLLLAQPTQIVALPEGRLLLESFGMQRQFVPVSTLSFRQVDGQEMLYFRENEAGVIEDMIVGNVPPVLFLRLPWYATPAFHLALLAGSLLLFLSALLAALFSWFNPAPAGTGAPARGKQARAVAVLLSLLNIFFVAGMVASFAQVSAAPYSVPLSMRLLQLLPWLSALLAAAMAGFTVLAWKNRTWNVAGRVHYTILTLAALAFVWFAAFWKLIAI